LKCSSGKPRKGEGNNLRPNPRRLQLLVKELDKWEKMRTEMTPISELPFDVRQNARKEKNKVVCRYILLLKISF